MLLAYINAVVCLDCVIIAKCVKLYNIAPPQKQRDSSHGCGARDLLKRQLNALDFAGTKNAAVHSDALWQPAYGHTFLQYYSDVLNCP